MGKVGAINVSNLVCPKSEIPGDCGLIFLAPKTSAMTSTLEVVAARRQEQVNSRWIKCNQKKKNSQANATVAVKGWPATMREFCVGDKMRTSWASPPSAQSRNVPRLTNFIFESCGTEFRSREVLSCPGFTAFFYMLGKFSGASPVNDWFLGVTSHRVVLGASFERVPQVHLQCVDWSWRLLILLYIYGHTRCQWNMLDDFPTNASLKQPTRLSELPWNEIQQQRCLIKFLILDCACLICIA